MIYKALLILIVSTVSLLCCGPALAGRIAIDVDGNWHDRDDIGGVAMTLAVLRAGGRDAEVVHISHSNHLWESGTSRESAMAISVTGTISRWGGFPQDEVYNAKRQTQATINNLRAEMQKSTAADPLWIIAGGPMEIIGRAQASGLTQTNRQNVHVVSHSGWNNRHADDDHNGYSFSELGLVRHQIADGNAELRGPRSEWYWLRDSSDPKLRWLWDRDKVAGKSQFDVSDATMAYWLLTGDQHGDPTDFKKLLTGVGVSVSVVPEPSTWLLVFVAAVFGRWRKRVLR